MYSETPKYLLFIILIYKTSSYTVVYQSDNWIFKLNLISNILQQHTTISTYSL